MSSDTKPALHPPAGVTPNFVDPPSIAWATIFTMILYLVMTTPIVAARIYTRAVVQKSMGWDDASQIVAQMSLVALAGLSFFLLRYGNGVDLWNVTQAQYALFNKYFGDFEIVARVGIFFTKLSILQLYLRYFCPARTKRGAIFWVTHFVIWFNLLYSIALILVVLLQCVGKNPAPGESCINENMVLVGASIINVVTDLMVLVIPIAAVWRMKMAKKMKRGLLVVFAVGGLAVAASIARLIYQIPQTNNPNRTVVNSIVIILAVTEQVVGQIAGCMPILPALWRHLRPSPATSKNYYEYNSNMSPLNGSGRRAAKDNSRALDSQRQTSTSDERHMLPIMTPTGDLERGDEVQVGKQWERTRPSDRRFDLYSTTVNGGHGRPHQASAPVDASQEFGVAKTVTVDVSSMRAGKNGRRQ